jgi:NAD(P)-dependent dehydrogenase (short-subunit alcohol dehydrogenase family)
VITADLTSKAVLITGGGSGIGLAATALSATIGLVFLLLPANAVHHHQVNGSIGGHSAKSLGLSSGAFSTSPPPGIRAHEGSVGTVTPWFGSGRRGSSRRGPERGAERTEEAWIGRVLSLL